MEVSKWFLVVPILAALISALLSLWLADSKLGNYRCLRLHVFISTVVDCLIFVTKEFDFENE